MLQLILLQVIPNLPGPSNIIRGIGEVPSSEKLAKTPMITQYAPQLPIGPPGPPSFFPHFPPVTPHSGPPVPPEIAGHLHKQEHDEQQQQHMALWQQHHQQQQWLKQLAEQQQQHQQQLHQLIMPPGSAHHPAPFPMPVVTSHGHAPHSAEPVAFTFNPEEVAAAMRPGGGVATRVGLQPGSIEHLAAAGLIPSGQQIIQSTPIPFPLDSYQLAMSGRIQEEQAAAAVAAGGAGLIPLIQAGVPISIEQQQLILAQQQQQVLAQVAALNNISLPDLAEFLRQSEAIAMQVQKEPTLLQDPNLQLMLKRREVLMQQIQSVSIQLEQFQRMQQEVILQHHHQQHQELLQKQQQQQFILTRPPLPEEVHSRNRPGVIVGHK